MNNLLSSGILDTPFSIFITPDRQNHIRELADRCGNAFAANMAPDESDLRQLAYIPNLLANMIKANFLSMATVTKLVATPTAALNLVSSDPGNLQTLLRFEQIILSSPETTEQLYYHLLRNDLLNEEWLKKVMTNLGDEPQRAIRIYTRHYGRDRGAELIEKIRNSVGENRTLNAAWSALWVEEFEVLDGAPLNQDIVESLSMSEEYCYRVMQYLRGQNYNPVTWGPLERAIRTPRWAYHVLRDGLIINDAEEERITNILVTDPGWLVEWLISTRMHMERVSRYCLQCSQAVPNHDLGAQMTLWLRSASIANTLTNTDTEQNG